MGFILDISNNFLKNFTFIASRKYYFDRKMKKSFSKY